MQKFQKLRALPVQLIETLDGIILKRGCAEIKLTGEGIAAAVHRVLWAATNADVTSEEICEQFSLPARTKVHKLIEQLVERRLLVPAANAEFSCGEAESNLDVFYWHFGQSSAVVSERLNDHFIILGVNCISRQLVASLADSDVLHVDVVDFPLLRNLRLFDEEGRLNPQHWPDSARLPLEYKGWIDQLDQKMIDCIIATSDFGNHEVLREWNKWCVERNCHFLPVVLHNVIGYIGPLVIPGETACFDCLRTRQDANVEEAKRNRALEREAFESQHVAGFHPTMTSILGNIAAFELTKFYSGVIPGWNVGSLIEVNLLATYVTARKVLKVPRCPACSPLNKKPTLLARKQTLRAAGERR